MDSFEPILAPVVALVAWTLLIMAWMAVTRFAAFKQMGLTVWTVPRGSRGANMEGQAPDQVMWKSHNYTHLHEQPTIFYAIALALALMDQGSGLNLLLAWGYVGLRILHSLFQTMVNIVAYQFAIFSLASLCLLGLTVQAGLHMLRVCGLIG